LTTVISFLARRGFHRRPTSRTHRSRAGPTERSPFRLLPSHNQTPPVAAVYGHAHRLDRRPTTCWRTNRNQKRGQAERIVHLQRRVLPPWQVRHIGHHQCVVLPTQRCRAGTARRRTPHAFLRPLFFILLSYREWREPYSVLPQAIPQVPGQPLVIPPKHVHPLEQAGTYPQDRRSNSTQG
jgi:hypothetical protein